jgi:hypothetical protein
MDFNKIIKESGNLDVGRGSGSGSGQVANNPSNPSVSSNNQRHFRSN